jgi:hypothetical protein
MPISHLAAQVISIPDVLRGDPGAAERLIATVVAARPGLPVVFAMGAVTWICPYGAVLLHGLCRYTTQRTGQAVELVGLAPNVHAYLRRIDFLEQAAGVAYTTTAFDPRDDYTRSRRSQSVLELFPVGTTDQAQAACARADRIVRSRLAGLGGDTIGNIITVLSEVCHNVAEHSLDEGLVIAQKYAQGRRTKVEIAISDLGQGIRRSLSAAHGDVADATSGFIRRALDGLSARRATGQGLPQLRRIAGAGGGTLSIRSGDSCVRVTPLGVTHRDVLTAFPGTQIAVTFYDRT